MEVLLGFGGDGEPAEAVVEAEVDAGFEAEFLGVEGFGIVLVFDIEGDVGEAGDHGVDFQERRARVAEVAIWMLGSI